MIIPLTKFKTLIFPLEEGVYLTRGIIINDTPGVPKSIKATACHKLEKLVDDEVTKLTRPGISVQRNGGTVTDILFLGGNKAKMCHLYNI